MVMIENVWLIPGNVNRVINVCLMMGLLNSI